MGVVDKAIQDRVCDCRASDEIVPARYWHLSGYQRGFPAVAFFADFQKVEALLIAQTMGSPVIEDQKLGPGELVDQTRKAAIEASHGEILEQAGHSDIEDRMIEARRLSAEGAGQPG